MVILVTKLPLTLSLPLMLQRPYEYQTLPTNLSFDTLLGLNYEILWIKLFKNLKIENHSKFRNNNFCYVGLKIVK